MEIKYKNAYFLAIFLLFTACGDADDKQSEVENTEAVQSIQLAQPQATTNSDVEFVNAAKQGDFRKVRAMLEQDKVTTISTNQDGLTALMAASAENYEDIVEIILDRISKNDTVRLDLGDNLGNTALTYATKNQHPDIIEILREHGASPNVFNKEKEFPIHIAVKNNDFKSADVLVEKISGSSNLNLNAVNADGKTAVHLAVQDNNPAFLRFLKNAGADLNKQDISYITPLSQAVINNKPEMVDSLITLGADINNVNDIGKTALIFAVEQENYPIAISLLNKKADPNVHASGRDTALEVAVAKQNANPELIKTLIAAGAKLQNVLSKAILGGNIEIVKILLDSGAEVSSLEKPKTNGLLQALTSKNQKIAVLMLENGADINKLNSEGYSPLALALQNGYDDLAVDLIKKKAELNPKTQNTNALPYNIVFKDDNGEMLELLIVNGLNKNPNQILLDAIADNKPRILNAALQNGANPNIADTAGQPAIWSAAAKSNLELLKVLHQNGANIEVADETKNATPLLISVVAKNKEVFNYLLDNGADPDVQDVNGLTPIAYSILTNQISFIPSLLQAGARTDITDANGNDYAAIIDSSELSESDKEKAKALLNIK